MDIERYVRNDSRLLELIGRVRRLSQQLSVESLIREVDTSLKNVQRAALKSLALEQERLRIVLVGDFNSGKSTLVNALFRRHVAATDFLEMTSWVACYRAASQDRVAVFGAEHVDEEYDFEEFRERCQKREWSEDKLETWEYVDIQVAGSVFSATVVDVPGLGSVTLRNEKRMLEALRFADAVLWLTDVDSVGAAKSLATVRMIKDSGTAVVPILTKIDALDDEEELDEIWSFLDEHLGESVESARFAVSALGYINNEFEDDDGRLGIDELRAFVEQMNSSKTELRKRAEFAAKVRVVDELERLTRRILEQARFCLERSSRAVEQIQMASQSVEYALRDDFRKLAREHVFGKDKAAVVDAVKQALDKGDTNFADLIPSVLGTNYLQSIATTLHTQLVERIHEEWAQSLQREVQNAVEVGLPQGLEIMITPENSRSSFNRYDELDTGVKVSAGAAALSTLLIASGGVPVAAALTGIGLPVVAGGMLTAYGMRWYKQKQNKEQAAGIVEHDLSDFIIRSVLEPAVLEPLLSSSRSFKSRLLDEAAEKSVEALCEDANGLLGEIGTLRNGCVS